MYVLQNNIAGFTGPKTVAEISCAANKLIYVHRVKLGQATSETDDSTRLEWGTYTASGTGTPVTGNVNPTDPGDSAYSGVAEDDHSVDITTGEQVLGAEGISLLAGFEKIFLPRSRPIIRGGEFFALQVKIAIASVQLVYEIEFEEIG
jgi:hypothetical protein